MIEEATTYGLCSVCGDSNLCLVLADQKVCQKCDGLGRILAAHQAFKDKTYADAVKRGVDEARG